MTINDAFSIGILVLFALLGFGFVMHFRNMRNK